MIGVYACFACVLTRFDLPITCACAVVTTGIGIDGATESWGGATSIVAGSS
jgi:hypothetical protein